MKTRNLTIPAGAGLLLLLTFLAYLPAMNGDFLWDDSVYLVENPAMQDGWDGLRRIWSEFPETHQYYPLTLSSFWVEYQLWGARPTGYHVVNVLLHVFNAWLLWAVLRRLAVPGAWVAAAVFALHPVHVESVAWIAERKNVLCFFFYLAALRVYLEFLGPAGNGRAGQTTRWGLYASALGLFVLGLLSKTAAGMVPVALLLITWWKGGRIRRADLVGVLPFFALAVAMAGVTLWLESSPARVSVSGWNRMTGAGIQGGWEPDLLERTLIASRALWFYVGKIVWPHPLAMVYPRWEISAADPRLYGYLTLTIASFVGLWLMRRRVGRGPLAGSLYFFANLVPALGFVDIIYLREYSMVADHFVYFASPGLMAVLVSAFAVRSRHRWSKVGWLNPLAAVLVLGALSSKTWHQAHFYRDFEALWRQNIRVNPLDYRAHNDLGVSLLERGAVAAAIEHFEVANRIQPDYVEPWSNLGAVWLQLGKSDQARNAYEQVLLRSPGHLVARKRLGVLMAQKGELDLAIAHFRSALLVDDADPDLYSNLGRALEGQGHTSDAISLYRKALSMDPTHEAASANLQRALGVE